MKKIPYGISNYKELIDGDYYYVDKTMYLPVLESTGKTIMCLRPGRFGKTLFTSMIYYYYDINSKSLFDSLFKDTYVYKNKTSEANFYYVISFNFSGLTTAGLDAFGIQSEFKSCITDAIVSFNTHYNFNINIDESNLSASEYINKFLSEFEKLNLDHKLYIIIDEYDKFTNAMLEGNAERFLSIAGNEGFIKAFYEVLKKSREKGAIGRIFMTGVSPVTLNSMTTGFNIATDISLNPNFSSMIGLTHEEVRKLLRDEDITNIDEIFNIMLDNYDGYRFSEESVERVFNATLVMYFMKNYLDFNKIPSKLIDNNVEFNHQKLENILKLQNNTYYREILDEILKNNSISGKLVTKFDLIQDLNKNDFISLLYYFGYLTIDSINLYEDKIIFKIPNYVMKTVYGDYFVELLKNANIDVDDGTLSTIFEEIAKGSIDTLVKHISNILKESDNRLFIKFNEKDISLLCFTVLFNNKNISVYNEYPCSNGYIDMLILSNNEVFKYNIMIEFKYIKVNDYSETLLESKREDAINQINKYSADRRLENLKKYIVVYVGSEVKVVEEVL